MLKRKIVTPARIFSSTVNKPGEQYKVGLLKAWRHRKKGMPLTNPGVTKAMAAVLVTLNARYSWQTFPGGGKGRSAKPRVHILRQLDKDNCCFDGVLVASACAGSLVYHHKTTALLICRKKMMISHRFCIKVGVQVGG